MECLVLSNKNGKSMRHIHNGVQSRVIQLEKRIITTVEEKSSLINYCGALKKELSSNKRVTVSVEFTPIPDDGYFQILEGCQNLLINALKSETGVDSNVDSMLVCEARILLIIE